MKFCKKFSSDFIILWEVFKIPSFTKPLIVSSKTLIFLSFPITDAICLFCFTYCIISFRLMRCFLINLGEFILIPVSFPIIERYFILFPYPIKGYFSWSFFHHLFSFIFGFRACKNNFASFFIIFSLLKPKFAQFFTDQLIYQAKQVKIQSWLKRLVTTVSSPIFQTE